MTLLKRKRPMGVRSLRTLFACNRSRAEDTTAFALLDELYRGILVAEERSFHVDIQKPVEFLGGS